MFCTKLHNLPSCLNASPSRTLSVAQLITILRATTHKPHVGLQIDIILAGDPQLAKEILYDMRQADNAQRAAAERAATAATAGSGGNAASAEAARRLSGSRTLGGGRGQQGGGRATDLRQEALRRSLQLPRRSGSGGDHCCFAAVAAALRTGINNFSLLLTHTILHHLPVSHPVRTCRQQRAERHDTSAATTLRAAHAGASPSGVVPGSPVAAQLLKERASSGGSRGMSTGSPLSPAAGFRGSPAGFAGRRTSRHVPAAAAAVEAFRSPAAAGVRPRTPGSGSASGVRYTAEPIHEVRLRSEVSV